MKKLIIYYSLDGNTRLIAQTIAKGIGADIHEIKTEKDIGNGAMKYLWGGSQVYMKKLPKLKPSDVNPNDYDFIFMGTPVWAWTSAPPMNSYLSQYKIMGKKIALFCSNDGNKGKTFQKMREYLDGNEILGEFETLSPLKQDREESVGKAVSWARSLVK
ncbi:MAG: flavodoxin family protein [Thermoplasmatota archaeon]